MKKFISALTALFIGTALLSATAGAEPSEPVSYFDIEQNITGEYDGIPENGIPKEDGFYLPSGYTVFDITGMYFSEDMTVIHITDDKMTVAFAQYYDREKWLREKDTFFSDDADTLFKELISYHGTDLSICEEEIEECDDAEGSDYHSYIMMFEENDRYFRCSVTSTKKIDTDDIAELSRYRRITFGKGFVKRDGKICYIKKNGEKTHGWLTVGGRKYYFKKDGSMATKKMTIGGIMYDFDKNGVCYGRYSGTIDTKAGVKAYKNGKPYTDKWGITIRATNVTQEGLDMEVLWDGTKINGRLGFGEHFYLQEYRDGKWVRVPYLTKEEPAFVDIEYTLNANEIRVLTIQWDYIYGELEDGRYRLCTDFTNFRKTADYDTRKYYASFVIR